MRGRRQVERLGRECVVRGRKIRRLSLRGETETVEGETARLAVGKARYRLCRTAAAERETRGGEEVGKREKEKRKKQKC
jgi:hypothetical protein